MMLIPSTLVQQQQLSLVANRNSNTSRHRSSRLVVTAAKRRYNTSRSNIGGGGRGRKQQSASPSEVALLKELAAAVADKERDSSSNKKQGFGGLKPSSNKEKNQLEGEDDDKSRSSGWLSLAQGRPGDDVDYDDDEDDDEALSDGELTDTELAELLGRDTTSPDVLEGADAEVEARLQSILGQFKFPLDAFQVKAVRHLLCDRSVVVCAPTGAGKTAIAEAASIHFLSQGKRVIYTTPLKALSNQKLRELRERFGTDSVGLSTGDASINLGADIVVMTTEILRNQLYRAEADQDNDIDSEAVALASKQRFADVGLVCLDECHYLGDPSRGSVWEEVIINLPRHIKILAMSATVRNPDDLTGWIDQVHGECDTVATSFRPVPLNWHYGVSIPSGKDSFASKLYPLFDDGGRLLNPVLMSPKKKAQLLASAKIKEAWGRWDTPGSGAGRFGGKKEGSSKRSNSNKRSAESGKSSSRTLDELLESTLFAAGSDSDGDYYSTDLEDNGGSIMVGPRWRRIPSLEGVVYTLEKQNMLPAIWFIFSRRECDTSAQRLHDMDITLTTAEEQEIIKAEVEALRADQPEAVKEGAVPALIRGSAAHHAGCLPGWKLLIEKLFQRGVVKLVFATETLAAGINMPAKTTIISALSRKRDGVIAPLTHNELLQMAGRAGRRGFDTVGHCVVLQSRWEDADIAWDIIKRGAEPLKSQFATSYGMALNLLYTRSMEQAREFLDRSFSRYLGGAGVERVLQQAEKLEAKAEAMLKEAAKRAGSAVGDVALDKLNDFVSSSSSGGAITEDSEEEGGMWTTYQKLQGRAKEEKRAVRLLRSQLAEERGQLAQEYIGGYSEVNEKPRIIGLDISGTSLEPDGYKLPALVIKCLDILPSTIFSTSNTDDETEVILASYLCLGADNMLYSISAVNIAAVTEVEPTPYQLEAVEIALSLAESVPYSAWQQLGGRVKSLEGSALTAAGAASLPVASSLTPLLPSEAGLEALQAQKSRLAEVKAQVATIKSDKRFAKAAKRYSQVATKAGVLLEQAAGLREDVRERTDGGWLAFESIVSVLEAFGAFDEHSNDADNESDTTGRRTAGGRTFTALGMVAREIRASNELWLSTVLTHEALQTLPPPQLAAVVSSILAAEAFSKPSVWAAYPAGDQVCQAVEALEPARSQLALLQMTSGVDCPLGVDLRLAGVVEAWASGASWSEITADCGLDDGDVARLLIRSVDVLRQVSHCEHLLPGLKQSARKAASAMDRSPISELIT